jgi:hypothetical protein
MHTQRAKSDRSSSNHIRGNCSVHAWDGMFQIPTGARACARVLDLARRADLCTQKSVKFIMKIHDVTSTAAHSLLRSRLVPHVLQVVNQTEPSGRKTRRAQCFNTYTAASFYTSLIRRVLAAETHTHTCYLPFRRFQKPVASTHK